ncbi:hypothetical protein ACFXP3_01770 [Streptomyces sp. NPDC059096]|uniref:hypothetical protein n=1 Tax=Streptomyces sp. NPDC059096 TaxID=3346727 RepID=UPI00369F79EB
MRVRITSTALGISAVLLALPACSTDTSTAQPGLNAAPLSSVALETRLLDERDLGSGYQRKSARVPRHDDVTVVGCPALNELGADAATAGSLAFPRKAKATFAYVGSSSSNFSEELYSDSASTLSEGIHRIFEAMSGCPTYRVIAGSTAIGIGTQKLTAPQLGDEQWSQLLTFSSGGQSTVVKQTAIRDGSVLLIVSGSPALVDRHIDKALAKATTGR